MKSQGSHYCSSVLGLIILGLPQWSSISTPTIILLLETMYKICLRCLFLMDASSGTTPVRLPIANKIALTLFGMFAFSLFRRILAHSLLQNTIKSAQISWFFLHKLYRVGLGGFEVHIKFLTGLGQNCLVPKWLPSPRRYISQPKL